MIDYGALLLMTLNLIVAALNFLSFMDGRKSQDAWATVAWVGSSFYWASRLVQW